MPLTQYHFNSYFMDKEQKETKETYTNSFIKAWEDTTCEYCGLRQGDAPHIDFHRDHIIPRIFGGTDDFENIAYACAPCNYKKGSSLGCKTLSGRKGKSDLLEFKNDKLMMPNFL